LTPLASSALPPADEGRRCTWISVWVNLFLTTVQFVVGIFSASQGLIADSVHSLSDLMADFVVLLAARHSKKDADVDHHYGHLRYENAASLVLGVLLLAVAAGMIWAALHKLFSPGVAATVHPVALWVALIALTAKETLFRYMLAVAKRLGSSMLAANAWHARSDAASSLVVALGIGGNLMGYPLLDPAAALVVGIMVGKMGWSFSWSALHDLMDRAASEDETEAIRQTLAQTPGVRGVHDLRTRKVGDLTLVDVHLEIDAYITVAEGHAITVKARQRVLDQHGVLDVMTHIDPYPHSS